MNCKAFCSTGEEAYSVGILIRECMQKLKIKTNLKVQIYATDLDPEAIRRARSGVYLSNISNDVSAERLERWFVRRDDFYQIVQEVREMVVFAGHNLIKDAPFTKLDLLCCRNVLIYLAPELQKKLLPIFHYTLSPDGFMFLGPSETISGFEKQFATVDSKWRVYKRLDHSLAPGRITGFPTNSRTFTPASVMPAIPERPSGKISVSLAEQTRKLLLEKHTPASVLINESGGILYVNGQTGHYLQLATGQADINVFDMAREGLAGELRSAVLRANTQKQTIVVSEVLVPDGETYRPLKLTIEPLEYPRELKGLLLVKEGETQRNSRRESAVKDLIPDAIFLWYHLKVWPEVWSVTDILTR